MATIIGLKQLRENVEKYVLEVHKGKSFTVVKKSKPVFRIVPPDEDNEMWETVVDFTEFNKKGVPARELLRRLRSLNAKSRKTA
ncbi:MAG: type II toxin-antitoxin system prevent-host-death family antitoxin [Candidatus Sungbacteria bacterium]|uniref:Type II toxin-antitoxin system prevent-host-death family antitoxin n=1 Tax=Candidatus Sungiibacteriota bacterium TaxID=2750080 RepID=A0A9D6QVM0_9BACT|nr:type II toxin-antitoxin system prevent-host-death family antitoxin [Candidatus Sungbacteria bacterium]